MKKDEKLFLFHQGTYYRAYEFMGCHVEDGGAVFRVWAPNARSVSVVGDFNGWDRGAHPMQMISEGVWEAEIAFAVPEHNYKYYITTADGHGIYKGDPYGFFHDCYGDKTSRVFDISGFEWTDADYLARRAERKSIEQPMNIYEAHVGSWRRGYENMFYNYRQFADEVVPYLTARGYTHIELLGVAEYPYDPSWGYQVTGYFAPTSRYGTPADFAYLINKLHSADIGVILDWVPGHFPKDANGLYRFDGSTCYEDPNPLRQEHKDWGTCCYDYGRTEVQTFLVSNANFWLDVYHIDGLRVDAVASMLYLDYGRNHGEWAPNSYGGKENLEAIAFLRKFNDAVHYLHPGCITIAEESTAFPMVTYPPCDGGLGFDYKWNMGWMNDNLSYIKEDPIARQYHHNKLTFTMMYAFSENFVLPISHDEIVYGKGSLLNKMSGCDIFDKFRQMRTFLMNMYAHPGKKLLMMGTEFAQFNEWNYNTGLDMFLVDQFDTHRDMDEFCKYLFQLYRSTPALYQIENSWEGFSWLVPDDANNNIIAFERRDREGNRLIAILNFSGMYRQGYRFGCNAGRFVSVLTTDGCGWHSVATEYKTEKVASHGFKDSLVLDVPSWGGIYLYSKAKKRKAKK